jgi:hypothetical protein
MVEVLSVSMVAAEIGCRPRDLSDAFYRGHVSADGCPVVNGMRLIPRSKVPEIRRALSSRGKIRPDNPDRPSAA